MRAPLAAIAADRISHCAIVAAGVLCGVLVFFVAVPLASSNPFPSPRGPEQVVHRSSIKLASLIPVSAAIEEQALLDAPPSMLETDLWDFVALPAHGATAGFKPPAPPSLEFTNSIVETPRPPRRAVSPMEEVDNYLWEVYRRSPAKRDSTGDFSWKDPAAAKRFGISMPAYVIGGMDADFREMLYHAGRAMDADGVRWSMLSAFRDDYRQSLASGFKASSSNSLHGGKARTGGYGHGQAIDISSDDGRSDSAVWRWIDRHGAKYGLYRPMPGADPAHIQPRGGWRKTAIALRETRTGTAVAQTQLAAARTKVVKASW
jgi:hypothetical protein